MRVTFFLTISSVTLPLIIFVSSSPNEYNISMRASPVVLIFIISLNGSFEGMKYLSFMSNSLLSPSVSIVNVVLFFHSILS